MYKLSGRIVVIRPLIITSKYFVMCRMFRIRKDIITKINKKV